MTDAAKVDQNLKGATQLVQQFYGHSKNTTIARNKINNVLCDLDHYIQLRRRVHNLKNIDVDLLLKVYLRK
ncbi:hypothetical protein CXF80_05145 [Shewanella sp. Actino-trap-3]|nr:hypothetical protein CXF80_05145 [Shewanella sp. Actino-trap-3]